MSSSGGDGHQRERERRALADLAVRRACRAGGGGSSTSVISSPGWSTVSWLGLAAGQPVQPGHRSTGPVGSPSGAAARCTLAPRTRRQRRRAMSDGWVATQNGEWPEDRQVPGVRAGRRGLAAGTRARACCTASRRPGSTGTGCAAAGSRRPSPCCGSGRRRRSARRRASTGYRSRTQRVAGQVAVAHRRRRSAGRRRRPAVISSLQRAGHVDQVLRRRDAEPHQVHQVGAAAQVGRAGPELADRVGRLGRPRRR